MNHVELNSLAGGGVWVDLWGIYALTPAQMCFHYAHGTGLSFFVGSDFARLHALSAALRDGMRHARDTGRHRGAF